MRQSKFFMLLISLFLIFAFYSCDDILNNDDTDPDPDPDPIATAVGDTLWIHSIENQDKYFINSSLAIGQNGYLYYAVSGGTVWWSAAKIIALNQEGQIMWESEDTDAIGIHSEIMIGDDGTVYVLGAHRLYAFDPSNGATKWIWEVPTTVPNPDNPQSDIYTYGELNSLALADNGYIMTQTSGSGSYARAIYCINPDGNTVYYNLGASGWGAETGLFIGKNNTCYYYSRDINFEVPGLSLVALDVLSGSVK
ncbi:MAG: hypothetical protein KJO29_02985, partial [Bacteroidia bacterium]|nr:hypothetical protein [Bacteroidia bacterium]